jgi:3-phenylpropionate/trans-cinnamate dioxygenase ferredoxin component
MNDAFIVVASRSELGPGQTRRVVVRGSAVLLANVDGKFHAVDDLLCTYEDSSWSPGCLRGELVDCTLLGSRFSVVTGRPVEEPGTEALRTRPVRVEGDDVLLQVVT